jgi:hypothetical protein
LVSRRLFEDGCIVGLMYRDRPFSPEDSGWRLFAGDEDGEFVADPRNTAMLPLDEVATRYPEAARHLDAAQGAAFEADASGRLIRAETHTE